MVDNLLTWALICQVMVKQLMRSSVGLPKLLKLLALCGHQYFLIVIYLSILRELFVISILLYSEGPWCAFTNCFSQSMCSYHLRSNQILTVE